MAPKYPRANIHRPSNVVPFWVWYGFLVRVLTRTTKKGTLEGLGTVAARLEASDFLSFVILRHFLHGCHMTGKAHIEVTSLAESLEMLAVWCRQA